MLDAKTEPVSDARREQVVAGAVPGQFDLDHLCAIHGYMFDGVYPWAGELRSVELTKGSVRFVKAASLRQSAKSLFEALRRENLMNNLPHEVYIEHLAHYYSEINILHPFRDGNGRAQREFFSLLAAESGRYIAWELMDSAEEVAANIQAYNGDESGLVRLLSPLVKQLN